MLANDDVVDSDTMTYRAAIWSAIRHRCYHLGELVYLRQVMGLDEPLYYHEAGWEPGREARKQP